jgi:hypothetical protein
VDHFHGKTQPLVNGMLSVLQVGVMVVVILEFTLESLHTQVNFRFFQIFKFKVWIFHIYRLDFRENQL